MNIYCLCGNLMHILIGNLPEIDSLSSEEVKRFDMDRIYNAWKKHNTSEIYDYKKHLEACELLEEKISFQSCL